MADAVPFVLINSQPRSGGTLLARLFDGHPAVRSFPRELWLGREKHELPSLTPAAIRARDMDAMIAGTGLGNLMGKLGRERKVAYGVVDEEGFRSDHLAASFQQHLSGKSPLDLEGVFDCIGRSFFECWLGVQTFDHAYWVNHVSRLSAQPAAKVLAAFPSARVIQTVRDPRASFVSERERPTRSSQSLKTLVRDHSRRWRLSTLNGIVGAATRPDRYRLVRYEDLLRTPEVVMHDLCGFLGITYADILLTPTRAGQPWSGNSSFGASQGLDPSRLDRWKGAISEAELSGIEGSLGGWMASVGYPLHGSGAGRSRDMRALRALAAAGRRSTTW